MCCDLLLALLLKELYDFCKYQMMPVFSVTKNIKHQIILCELINNNSWYFNFFFFRSSVIASLGSAAASTFHLN